MRISGNNCIFETSDNQSVMKYTFLTLLVLATLTSCNHKEPLYMSLTESEYRNVKAQDTIINTGRLLVTCTGTADSYNNMDVILVRKTVDGDYEYFQLGTDVYFENTTTLIQYQGFFSSDADGPFKKNGIWVYTDYYNDKTGNGMNFAVDSLPPVYADRKRPQQQGIYYYRHHKLERLSADQSEETFREIGKDGFYFIPNSGRFFKRYSVAELQ